MMGKPVCLLCMNVSRSEIIASIRKSYSGGLCLRVCLCETEMMPVVCPCCAGMKVWETKGLTVAVVKEYFNLAQM